MTTVDRVDSVGYRPWVPTSVLTDDYVGRHRKAGLRWLAVHRMFYLGRHRRR